MTLDRAPNATSYCTGWWWGFPEPAGSSPCSCCVLALLVLVLPRKLTSACNTCLLLQGFGFAEIKEAKAALHGRKVLHLLGTASSELSTLLLLLHILQGCTERNRLQHQTLCTQPCSGWVPFPSQTVKSGCNGAQGKPGDFCAAAPKRAVLRAPWAASFTILCLRSFCYNSLSCRSCARALGLVWGHRAWWSWLHECNQNLQRSNHDGKAEIWAHFSLILLQQGQSKEICLTWLTSGLTMVSFILWWRSKAITRDWRVK